MDFQTGRAFEHIDKLAYEIGPRLAGSKGDQLAAGYIHKQFSEMGLVTRSREFKFVDRQLRRKVMALLFGTAFVSILFLPPLLSLAVWLAAIIVWRSLGKILPKRTSRNIVAKLKAEKPGKTVALSAHFDSAPCRVGHKFALFIRFSFLPISILVLFFLSARMIWGFESWVLLWVALAAYFLPLCVYLFVSGSNRRISPGANDNASGVAVVLEVARALAEAPSLDTEVVFVASGAEEQGLVGMKKLTKGKVIPKSTPVLNLDGVGVGQQPYLIEGNGLLRKVRTSDNLNRVLAGSIERGKMKPKTWWAPLARHDHIPLVKAGYPATTLTFDFPDEEKGRLARIFNLPNAKNRAYPHIHTKDDLPDRLNPKTIERTGQIVLDFVKTI